MQIIAMEKLTCENFQKISNVLQGNYLDQIAAFLLDEPELFIDVCFKLKAVELDSVLRAKLLSKSEDNQDNLFNLTNDLHILLLSNKILSVCGLDDFDLNQTKDQNALQQLLEDFFSANIEAACRLANDSALVSLIKKYKHDAQSVFVEMNARDDSLKLNMFTELGAMGLAELIVNGIRNPAIAAVESVVIEPVEAHVEFIATSQIEAKPIELSTEEMVAEQINELNQEVAEEAAIQQNSSNCLSFIFKLFKPQPAPALQQEIPAVVTILSLSPNNH